MELRPSEHSVDTPSGALTVHCWASPEHQREITVVTVHPWAPLGGGEHNTVGIAAHLASAGLRVLTFDLRSSSMIWGALTSHRAEVKQVCAVCEWARATYGGRILLLRSSAGAPVAGTALDRTAAVGLIAIGYTFGALSAIAFRGHFGPVLRSPKPKLFLQGQCDEFTSPTQLEARLRDARGDNESFVFPNVGHFELEAPGYDGVVAGKVVSWVVRKLPADGAGPHATL